jgi:hypothetical protein
MSENTFQPVIREGAVLAGGMRLAQIDGQALVFEDRWQKRCRQRGTDEVRIQLEELLDELIRYYQQQENW